MANLKRTKETVEYVTSPFLIKLCCASRKHIVTSTHINKDGYYWSPHGFIYGLIASVLLLHSVSYLHKN